MASSLLEFQTHIRRVGLPLGCQYFVTLPGLFAGSNQEAATVSMLCEATSIPGFSHMTNEIRTMGEVTELPYAIAYPGITLSFYLDNDGSARKYFTNWASAVYDRDSRTVGYYRDYVQDIEISIVDKQGNQIYGVTLFEAYPKAVSDIAVGYGSRDVLRLDVQIQYKYWERTFTEREVSDNSRDFLASIGTPPDLTAAGTESAESLGTFKGSGLQVPTIQRFGTNIGQEMSTWSSALPGEFGRRGNSIYALMNPASITSSLPGAEGGYTTFGSDFGGASRTLGSQMGTFAGSIDSLGKSLTSVAGPAVAIANSIGAAAGTVRSMSSLLSRMGISNNLGKIGYDMGQVAGRISVMTQLNGIPGALGSVGANMGALGGELDRVSSTVGGLTGSSSSIKSAISSFGSSFSNRGLELGETCTALNYTLYA